MAANLVLTEIPDDETDASPRAGHSYERDDNQKVADQAIAELTAWWNDAGQPNTRENDVFQSAEKRRFVVPKDDTSDTRKMITRACTLVNASQREHNQPEVTAIFSPNKALADGLVAIKFTVGTLKAGSNDQPATSRSRR